MDHIAHKTEDGRVQSVKKHLDGTSSMAEAFAVAELKPYAKYIGAMHDIGKYAVDFQNRIKGINIKFEHAVCGAIELEKLNCDRMTKIIM